MKKKRITSIIMLAVLVIGIACVVYGLTGTAIYENAAKMMGSDKKAAMGFIQDPSTLTEIGDVGKIGADKVRSFLKGLGLDAAKVDAAVDSRAAYEAAVANAKDRDAFFAYAQSVDETVTEDNLNDLIKDRDRSDQMRRDMAMAELGMDDAAFDAVAENTELCQLSNRHLCDVRHQIVRNTVGIFTDQAALMRTDRVKVTKEYNVPFGICLLNIREDLLKHGFCPAVRICTLSLGAFFGDRNERRITIDCR